MRKFTIVFLVVFAALFGSGCDPARQAEIEVTSLKLEEWKSPDDGETYLVAMPTWKNKGPAAAQSVRFIFGIKGKEEEIPTPAEPTFYGESVDAGTEVVAKRVPEDGVVLGKKSELEKKYGELTSERLEVAAFGSTEPYEPEKKSP